MPVGDLSYITRTYIELIRRNLVIHWPSGTVPTVLPVPPGKLDVEGIGFYLYHVIQKKEYDSFSIPTREPEARFLPMAVSLYYQLTANSLLEDENGAYNEQLMMSIAMKTLHDYPVIIDTTITPGNPTPVMDINIRGKDNRFQISQQPVAYNDAVHNWTAGQAAMKLSAYYEVAPAFLEADDLTSYSGRVLQYGNYVFVKGAPRIAGSRNTIRYHIPGDPVTREIKVQPAQAPPSQHPPAAVLEESIINFSGEGFEGGDLSLRLLHPRFADEVIAGPDWNVAAMGTGNVKVTVREKAVLESNGMPVDILPGVYSAQVTIKKTVRLPNGTSKEFRNSSNQFPFIVVPRVNSISALAGTICTVTGYIFQYIVSGADILADAIEVYADETKMIRNSIVLFSPGEFRILNASTMQLNIAGTLNPGMNIPIRIVIAGAESGPAWAVVT